MTRPKKKTPPEKVTIAPGIERITVGRGFTRRHEIRINRNITSEELKRYFVGHPLLKKLGFDGYIAEYEQEAKKTLGDAGFPTETDRFYTIPGGELIPIPTIQEGATDIYTRAVGLLELVESRDRREREAPEWYAAAILNSVLNIRLAIRRGDGDITASCAVELGVLIAEAKELGYSRGTGKTGGSKAKKILPVAEWLHHTVKQYPDKPYTFYWNSLPNHDEGDTSERKYGADMIREGGVLVVKGADGRKRFLAKTSFKRYVDDMKKDLKK